MKSDLGDLMESLKYASIINYEVVYISFIFQVYFLWLQVYIEKEIHDDLNFSVISNVL